MESRKSLSRRLEAFLAREDMTIDELVDAAGRFLVELVPRQSRYRVTERPDARTIRFYVSQNLLPKPVSYGGGRARYAGSHLLRLLMIKALQAEHHTLKRIAKELDVAADEQVLARLTRQEAVSMAESPAPVAVRRIRLPRGGSVDLHEEALGSPARRRELAESLEALARSLRNGGLR